MQLTGPRALLNATFLLLSAGAVPAMGQELPDTIEFNRDVRPILSDKCYRCHGPDSAARKASLRLDVRDMAIMQHDGAAAIVPGDPEASLVYQRITAEDPADRMPPEQLHKPLTDLEIRIIRRWIEQGADYEVHWSFLPIEVPGIPGVEQGEWNNPIDAFVNEKLKSGNRKPRARADRQTLLRRVTFDLSGLPPTVEETDAFLADDREDAWNRVIDRLLASPRYGEHKGRYWLDAARFAGTHGLHLDNERTMWAYRDWVIQALNDNMPFDQFTVEQLAGDLLEDASTDQLIASGFNRCNITTSEGGAINEEYLLKYAVDRVETTSTIWLGLTTGCAACHDHKYDPISQKEFYELLAFFNNTTEAAMDGNIQGPPPVIRVPTTEQEEEIQRIRQVIESLDSELEQQSESFVLARNAWAEQRNAALEGRWSVLEPTSLVSSNGTTFTDLGDGSHLAGGENPDKEVYEFTTRTDLDRITAMQLEALTHESLPRNGPGRWKDNGNFVLTEIEIETVDGEAVEPVRLVRAIADYEQPNYPSTRTIDGDFGDSNGWAVAYPDGSESRSISLVPESPISLEADEELLVRLHFQSRFPMHSIGRLRITATSDPAAAAVSLSPWMYCGPFRGSSSESALDTDFGPESIDDPEAVFQQDRKWVSRSADIDGIAHPFTQEPDSAHYLRRTIHSPTARTITVGLGSDDALKVVLNDQVVLRKHVARGAAPNQDTIDLDLVEGDNELLFKIVNISGASGYVFSVIEDSSMNEPANIALALSQDPTDRTVEQDRSIQEYYRRQVWPRGRELVSRIDEENARIESVENSVPTTLVSQENMQRRKTHVMMRGQYDQPGEEVNPDTPKVLPGFPAEAPRNRLGFANWLTDPDHPLVARVTVNRIWQEYFGTGLVATTEDFGSQGELPSHPELLDWLAAWFIQSGWDLKALHRLIVISDTYCQEVQRSEQEQMDDPGNRMLSRGPRFRLDAEMIRDMNLHVSGLLVEKLGGPSVKPYQPDGLWFAVGYTRSNTARFTRDDGDDLYRRSVYTFWKRTSPPPSMTTFDAPSRESCTVRRERTNTPLAALLLMNDEQFVESARNLARRAIIRNPEDLEEQLTWAFRAVLTRHPTRSELDLLGQLYDEQRRDYIEDPDSAMQLLSVGESPRDIGIDQSQYAAMTIVMNLILNLDEAITKG